MGIEFLNNLPTHEISADRLVNKSVLEKNTELRTRAYMCTGKIPFPYTFIEALVGKFFLRNRATYVLLLFSPRLQENTKYFR